jgi:hypothetical protein
MTAKKIVHEKGGIFSSFEGYIGLKVKGQKDGSSLSNWTQPLVLFAIL